MKRNLQFSEIYTYLIENDVISQKMMTIFNMPENQLENYLTNIKSENPYLFGQILAYAYADSRTRKKLLSAIA